MTDATPHDRVSMLGITPKGVLVNETSAHMTDLADLASLVVIQEEATVSRTVLKAEGVRIVLFAFDKGQVLTEHTAAMPVLLQTVEGLLRITADGRSVVLAPGDVIHMDTRLPHAVEALEPSKLALTMIDARATPTVRAGE